MIRSEKMRLLVKRFVSLFMGGFILVLAACASVAVQISTLEPTTVPTNTVAIPITGGDLVNTRWTLVSFYEAGTDISVIEGANPTLDVQGNDQAGGSGGCNSFGAQYEVQDSTITFHEIV